MREVLSRFKRIMRKRNRPNYRKSFNELVHYVKVLKQHRYLNLEESALRHEIEHILRRNQKKWWHL